MTATFHIQPVMQGQAPFLAAIHAESFGAQCWSVDQISGSLMLTSTQGWVVTADDRALQGFILVQNGAEQWEILTLCVRPSARQHGAGRLLLEAAQEAAAAAKASLFLEVAEDNQPARRLYEAAGFVLFGTRPNYYHRDGIAVTAACYRWPADSKGDQSDMSC